MQDIITWLTANGYGEYVTWATMVCYFVTQVVAHLPPAVTAKIPDMVMKIVNLIAGNYKHSSNEKTDLAGNEKAVANVDEN